MTLSLESRFVEIVAPIVVGLILLAAWELLCRAYNVPIHLFPKPSDIAGVLISDGADLMRALWSTLRVTFLAFFIATVVGTLIAFLFVQSRLIEVSFFPYAVLLQVTPIVAIAPLIIILMRDTQLALITCATIIAIFPIISNTVLGLRSVNPGLSNLFRMYKANRLKTLMRLRIPSALPYFFGGLRISSGATEVTALLMDAMRKMEFERIGVRESASMTPMLSRYTMRPCRAISATAPSSW
jgi:NitT/TauT family transport system permease protein